MRVKHIPQRTCVVCRRTRPKRELIRLIRTPDGQVEVDLWGKKAGRGAYLCRSQKCYETMLAGNRLERALRVKITSEGRARLAEASLSLFKKEAIDGS